MCMSSIMSLRCRSFFVYEMLCVCPLMCTYVLHVYVVSFVGPLLGYVPSRRLNSSYEMPPHLYVHSVHMSLLVYVRPCVCPRWACLLRVYVPPLPCVCLSSPCLSVCESLRVYAPSVCSVHMSLCVGPLCGLWRSQWICPNWCTYIHFTLCIISEPLDILHVVNYSANLKYACRFGSPTNL